MRDIMLAGTAMIAVSMTPGTAAAQQPATPPETPYDTLVNRIGDLDDRLQDARGDVMDGPHTRITWKNPCDLEKMRAGTAEYEALGREVRAALAGARAAGEFSTVSVAEMENVDDYVTAMIDMWRRSILHCEKQVQLRIGESSGPVSPTPTPTPSPVALPDPLEAMLLATASRERYLQLRAMAETGATRPTTRPLESILDEIDDDAVAGQVEKCRTALRGAPPPFAAAVLAAEERADDEPELWFPEPDLGGLKGAADDCAPLGDDDRIGALKKELHQALAADIFEQRFGTRPAWVRPTQTVRDELDDARQDGFFASHNWGELFIGAGSTEVPQTGIGVRRGGPPGDAPEVDAGLTGDKVSTIIFGGSLGFGDVRVRGEYAEGDASTTFDREPISGGFNGSVYGGLSPGGNSGIGGGTATVVGATNIDLGSYRLGADVYVAQPAPATRIFISFDYLRSVRTYTSFLTGTAGSAIEFTQERAQRVRDSAFGAGVGGEVRIPFQAHSDGGAGLSLRVVGTAQGYLLDSDLRSTERNRSNFGGDEDRDFTLAIDEGDTGMGFRGDAMAELQYRFFNSRIALFARAGASYASRVGAVFNPNSGDQVFFDGLTTALRTEDSWSWRAGGGIMIRLGGR